MSIVSMCPPWSFAFHYRYSKLPFRGLRCHRRSVQAAYDKIPSDMKSKHMLSEFVPSFAQGYESAAVLHVSKPPKGRLRAFEGKLLNKHS